MAIIGNNADTLLHGLSDFWLKYFQDLGDIQAAYEGTEILLGQTYLDLLSAVLNQGVTDVPLFNKKYYKTLTVREDQLVYRSGTGWALTTERFKSLPSLQNKVFGPTAALEEGIDYTVADGELVFVVDPTNPPVQGYAQRPVQVLTGGFFTSDSVTDWTALDVKKGDVLEVVAPGRAAQRFTLVHVKETQLSLSTETPAPAVPVGAAETVYTWTIVRSGVTGSLGLFTPPGSLQVYEVSFWAVDAAVDERELYRVYGHFFGDSRASTETYRAFIRGLMQLYALGPAIDRVESAMQVVAGLAVVRDDGETLLDYTDDGVTQSVITTARTYTYPLAIPLRRDVKDSANFGTLTFKVFEPLTTAIQVVDHLKDPTWWHNTVVPEHMLPGRNVTARTASPQLYPLVIGVTGNWLIGDPGVHLGATEDGTVRANVQRHGTAFLLMDRYLKHHMFAVKVDASITSLSVDTLQAILQEVKPSYTAIHLQT